MGPFTFASKRGEGSLSYYESPPEAIDSSDLIRPWAALGLAAARRAAKSKK